MSSLCDIAVEVLLVRPSRHRRGMSFPKTLALSTHLPCLGANDAPLASRGKRAMLWTLVWSLARNISAGCFDIQFPDVAQQPDVIMTGKDVDVQGLATMAIP